MTKESSESPRKLRINWPPFLWRKLKQWAVLEILLFVTMAAVLLVISGDEARWTGVAISFVGFISVCAWYFLFVRVWEKAYTLDRIEAADHTDRRSVILDSYGFYFTARKPGVYWILFDEDIRTGLKTPGPLLVALHAVLWFVVWFITMMEALRGIESTYPLLELVVPLLTLTACWFVLLRVNPRAIPTDVDF